MLNHSHIVLDIPLGCQILGAFQRACRGKHSYYSCLRSESGRLHCRLHSDELDMVPAASRRLQHPFPAFLRGRVSIEAAKPCNGCGRGSIAGHNNDIRTFAHQVL